MLYVINHFILDIRKRCLNIHSYGTKVILNFLNFGIRNKNKMLQVFENSHFLTILIEIIYIILSRNHFKYVN